MKAPTDTTKSLETTLAAIGHHIAETRDYAKMMDEIGGAPSVYLEKHGINVPNDITITCVRVFSSKSRSADDTAEASKKKKDRYVGEATWNNGHYICRVYERPNGTQYEVCWCR